MTVEFCSYCISLQTTTFGTDVPVGGRLSLSRTRHQSDCTALAASAESGCRLCQIILESISKHQTERGEVGLDGQPILPPGEVEVSSSAGADGTRDIWVAGNRLPRASGRIRTSEIPRGWKDAWQPDARSIDSMGVAMINKWIVECRKNHLECSPSISAFVPSRVVDVAGVEGDSVKLLETHGLGLESQDYTALSHCWGKNMPSTATTLGATLKTHLREIPLEHLTQTFKDAVSITRQLNVRFLWIDSLCIIQDSKEDWEAEAAQMADVYSNSCVTLAASASSNWSQGCRVPCDTPWTYVDVPMAPTADGRRCRVFSWSDNDSRGIHNDPLQGRGWTLQERELSPRVAYFSGDTVLWECYKSKSSLRFPWDDSMPFIPQDRVFEINNKRHRLPKGRLSTRPSTLEDELCVAQEWLRLVTLYTRRSLTKQEDALPAISGIARVFAQFTPGAYQAGLFEAHGIIRFLWHVATPHNDKTLDESSTSQRPQEYTGPSWSWSSVIGPVQWGWYLPFDKVEALASVIEVFVKQGGVDIFGRVEEGSFMRMRGKFRTFSARHVLEAHGEAGDPAKSALFGYVAGVEVRLGSVVFDVLSEQSETIYCMACARIGSWPQIYGIALVPTAESSSSAQFRRIGRVQSAERAWSEDYPVADITVI